MAAAIESYFLDNEAYPPHVSALDPTAVNHGDPAVGDLPSFRRGLGGVTTPLAYLTSYYRDAWAHRRGTTFVYYTDGEGWILTSPGPDGDYDIDPRRDYNVSMDWETLSLRFLSYDPTNGTFSSGDVFRLRQ